MRRGATNGGSSARTFGGASGIPRILLVIVVLAVTLGLVVSRWPTKSLLLVAVVALAIGIVRSREFGLGAILVTSLVMLSMASWFGLPSQSLLVTTALIGLFALTVMLDLGHDNPLRVPVSLVILVVVLAISVLAGVGNKIIGFYALAMFMAAPVAYVAIVHANLTLESLRRIGLIVIAIILAQAPIVVAQAVAFASHVDQMGGTFGLVGGTHVQAVVMGFAWTIAVALLYGRRRIWLLPVGLVIAVVLLVSEAKAGFFFAATGTIVVGLFQVIEDPRRKASSLIGYGIIGAAAISVIFIAYAFAGSLLPGGEQMAASWASWLRNPAAIRSYAFSYNSLGNADRLESVRLVLIQPGTAADLLIGRGIGLLTRSALLGQAVILSSASMAGALSRATSAARSLYEIGLLGTALYLVAVGSAAGAVVKAWEPVHDDLGIAVGAAAVGAAVIYALSAFYMTSWITDAVAVLFWCLMGMAVKWGHLRAAESEPSRDSSGSSGRRLQVSGAEEHAEASSGTDVGVAQD